MNEYKFKAFYNGKWYGPALIGGTQVPQVFNAQSELVNLCAHTEEYYVARINNAGDIIDMYINPDLVKYRDS